MKVNDHSDLITNFNKITRERILDEVLFEFYKDILKNPQQVSFSKITQLEKQYKTSFKDIFNTICGIIAKSYINGNKELETLINNILQENGSKSYFLPILKHIDKNHPLFNSILDKVGLEEVNDFVSLYLINETSTCKKIPQESINIIGERIMLDVLTTPNTLKYANNIYIQNHPDKANFNYESDTYLPDTNNDYMILSHITNFDLLEKILHDSQEFVKSKNLILNDILFEPKVTALLNNVNLPPHLREKLRDFDYDLSNIITGDDVLVEASYRFYSTALFENKAVREELISSYEISSWSDKYYYWFKHHCLTNAQELDFALKLKEYVDNGNRGKLHLTLGRHLAYNTKNEDVMDILLSTQTFADDVLRNKNLSHEKYNDIIEDKIAYIENYKIQYPSLFSEQETYKKFNISCRLVKDALKKEKRTNGYEIPENLVKRIANLNIRDIDAVAIFNDVYPLDTLYKKIKQYASDNSNPVFKNQILEFMVTYAARQVGFENEEIDACVKNFKHVNPEDSYFKNEHQLITIDNKEKLKQYDLFIQKLKDTFREFKQDEMFIRCCDSLKEKHESFRFEALKTLEFDENVRKGDLSHLEQYTDTILKNKLATMANECTDIFYDITGKGLSLIERRIDAIDYIVENNEIYKEINRELTERDLVERWENTVERS